MLKVILSSCILLSSMVHASKILDEMPKSKTSVPIMSEKGAHLEDWHILKVPNSGLNTLKPSFDNKCIKCVHFNIDSEDPFIALILKDFSEIMNRELINYNYISSSKGLYQLNTYMELNSFKRDKFESSLKKTNSELEFPLEFKRKYQDFNPATFTVRDPKEYSDFLSVFYEKKFLPDCIIDYILSQINSSGQIIDDFRKKPEMLSARISHEIDRGISQQEKNKNSKNHNHSEYKGFSLSPNVILGINLKFKPNSYKI